eukprot:TRINITY_DN40717_c0_g1_i1.p1 TRINITY_DN40717_c0_g1~~TRINITY_DN40717_c0_g1_i1.p1  ORF type:complete len:303 (-),score=97.64 TRINITY_DN40717_c0_g1_i1:175-1083(-)
MKRQELEAMSVAELRQVITDATMVLAAKAEKADKAVAGPFGSTAASSSPAGAQGLFQFGASSSSATGASIFSPPDRNASSGSSGGALTLGPLFGGTGGGLFGGAVAAAAVAPNGADASGAKAAAEEDEDDEENVEEEEVTAIHGWTPTITLEVKDIIETGEEEEETVYDQRSKLYRYRENQWKERGLGQAKLLKNRKTQRIRFLLRQERTGKVVANHFVLDHELYCSLRPNADSDKIWVWVAQDYAEGDVEVEQFALKFGTTELAAKFKEAFESAREENGKVARAGAESADSAAASAESKAA